MNTSNKTGKLIRHKTAESSFKDNFSQRSILRQGGVRLLRRQEKRIYKNEEKSVEKYRVGRNKPDTRRNCATQNQNVGLSYARNKTSKHA